MPDHTTDYDDSDQYHFKDIRPGDIVHDLGQMGWPKMRVLRQEAPSVADYIDTRGQDLRDYEKNALAGADLDDRVFLVTFLTDSPYNAAKTHYPVPETRIAKQDLDSQAEHIGDDHDPVFHPYEQAVLEFLTATMTRLKSSGDQDAAHALKDVAHAVLDDATLTDIADDVSQANADLGEVTPDGGAEPADDDANPGGSTDEPDGDDAETGGEQADDDQDDGLGDFEDYQG